MKAIVVVLLVVVGVGMIALAPVANNYMGESTFGIKLPQRTSSTQPAREHKATTTFARFMQVAGGVMILVGLAVGLMGRTPNVE